MPAYRDPVVRFLEKIDFPTEHGACWVWNASRYAFGYGQFRVDEGRRSERAHRYAYELWIGPLPDGEVMHVCDNPPCVNPDHLMAGTHRDNMADMNNKGRHFTPWTEPRPQKLTEEQVAEIRSLYVKGSREFGTVALGKEFGVSHTMIHYIVTEQKWNTRACKAELASSFRRVA